MEQEPHHARALGVALLHLLGAHLAQHDRVDGLQMGRIRGQAEMHLLAARQVAIGRGAEVVLDVARAQHVVGHGGALELGEDRGVRLAHDVGEHVEPAAMRHADHDLVDPELGRAPDDRLERRHRALAAVETEPLGAGELDVQKALEALGDDQLLEDLPLVLDARPQQVVRALHAGLNPGLLLGVLDVHELDADPRAVGLAQDLEDLPERRLLQAEDVVEEELALQIGVGKAVGLGVELRMMLVAREPERVEVGQQVAAHPVGPDQHHHAQVIDDQAPRALAAEIDDLAAVADQAWRPASVVGARPHRAAAALEQAPRLGPELVEVAPPARVDGTRIAQVARVEVFDEGAVAAVQKRGLLELESLGHGSVLLLPPPLAGHRAGRAARREHGARWLTIRLSRPSPRASSGRSPPGCRRP